MMDELRDLLEADEGIKHEIYLDHLGKATTGIGHLLVEQDPEESWPVPAQITVVSLSFQLGSPRYTRFVKHHEALEEQLWMTAAAELRDSKLYRQTPERTERHAQRLESLAT